MCRVFLKEILLLQNNQLNCLQNGGSLKDLTHITVLNLKDNKFSSLPETIGYLCNLKDLNLENNRLKKLPQSFEKLSSLQQLNLKGNKFSVFPTVLCKICSLELLNICDNEKLKTLPTALCNLPQLKCLELDTKRFSYPPEDICAGGIEQIMRFLCNECGIEFESRSFLIPAKESPNNDDLSPKSESSWDTTDLSEQRRQELILMEEAIKESDELHAGFAAGASIRRQKLLEDFAEEQKRMDDEIIQLQNKKEKEKQNLLTVLTNIENHSAELIEQLMCLTERTRKFEGMLEVLEQDKLDNEELFCVKQEELAQLRKKEVLEAMTEMLQAEERQRQIGVGKLNTNEKLQNNENETSAKLLTCFYDREQDKKELVNKILDEELYQREAFKALQLQKDHQHQNISNQIKLIEKELLSLTLAEIKKKDLKLNTDVNTLAEHRTALAYLFEELLRARDQRELELKEYVKEMEEKRLEEMQDFWLIQYQKLLDRKPQAIIQAEMNLDSALKNLLVGVGGENLLPLFAAKGITWSQFLDFTVKDLKRVGVLDDEMCSAIIKAKNVEVEPEWTTEQPSAIPEPSAPAEEGEPTAPLLSPDQDVRLWCQTECVVCMDSRSTAVFLPCGHVCCCSECSSTIESCPMCRTSIASKFAFTFPF